MTTPNTQRWFPYMKPTVGTSPHFGKRYALKRGVGQDWNSHSAIISSENYFHHAGHSCSLCLTFFSSKFPSKSSFAPTPYLPSLQSTSLISCFTDLIISYEMLTLRFHTTFRIIWSVHYFTFTPDTNLWHSFSPLYSHQTNRWPLPHVSPPDLTHYFQFSNTGCPLSHSSHLLTVATLLKRRKFQKVSLQQVQACAIVSQS